MTTLENTGQVHGLPLPEGVLPAGESWHPQTLAWWEELRRHPVMCDEPGLSWAYALDTARLHHEMWQRGQLQYAGEIRLRAAKFAITPEDRQRLRVRVTQRVEAAEVPARVADIASRRARLTE